MPRGPCLHIRRSWLRLILPSFLSSKLSSGDCLTTSQGFLILTFDEVGCARIGMVCSWGTEVPFSRRSVGVEVCPLEGPFCDVVRSWYPTKSLSPCLDTVTEVSGRSSAFEIGYRHSLKTNLADRNTVQGLELSFFPTSTYRLIGEGDRCWVYF